MGSASSPARTSTSGSATPVCPPATAGLGRTGDAAGAAGRGAAGSAACAGLGVASLAAIRRRFRRCERRSASRWAARPPAPGCGALGGREETLRETGTVDGAGAVAGAPAGAGGAVIRGRTGVAGARACVRG